MPVYFLFQADERSAANVPRRPDLPSLRPIRRRGGRRLPAAPLERVQVALKGVRFGRGPGEAASQEFIFLSERAGAARGLRLACGARGMRG